MLNRLFQFLTYEIWRVKTRGMPAARAALIKIVRVIVLTARGFNENQCQLRASALTFFTLLSIVPVLAMAFGIAKGFGFELTLQRVILERLKGQEEVINRVITFANEMLQNTKGGLVAGLGVLLLFWSIINLLGSIETAFNEIWGVKRMRTIGRRITDYLSVMLVCPVLLIMSSSVTVMISAQVKGLVAKLSFLGPLGTYILLGLNLLPYAVMWVLFSFIYIFMPNTKVSFSSGVLGGVIAGTIYQIVQWFYIAFQVGVAKYNAIYGSFAALPLFLGWLQLSWIILLFGAEVSFAWQNADTYEYEPDCHKASKRFKRLCALLITRYCVMKFKEGLKPSPAQRIAHELDMPVRLVRELLSELVDCGILAEVKDNDSSGGGYQPAVDISSITAGYVLNKLGSNGIDMIQLAPSEDLEKIKKLMDNLEESAGKHPSNKPLGEL